MNAFGTDGLPSLRDHLISLYWDHIPSQDKELFLIIVHSFFDVTQELNPDLEHVKISLGGLDEELDWWPLPDRQRKERDEFRLAWARVQREHGKRYLCQ
jgi:hypothetical protein